MDFELTDEQKMIRDMVRDFAENEIAPIAAEIDEEQRFPKEIFEKMVIFHNNSGVNRCQKSPSKP